MIQGLLGDDTFAGGAGDGGTEMASFSASASAATVDLSILVAQATGEGSDTFTDIENLRGSPLGDDLTGNGDANRFRASRDDDDLVGGLAQRPGLEYPSATNAMTIDLGAGTASAMAPTLDRDRERDRLAPGRHDPGERRTTRSTARTATTDLGVDNLGSGLGNDSFTGGDGTATGSPTPTTTGHDFDVAAGTRDRRHHHRHTFSTFELYTRLAGNDDFVEARGGHLRRTQRRRHGGGGEGADDLTGNSGNDTLSGNGGVDLLVGDSTPTRWTTPAPPPASRPRSPERKRRRTTATAPTTTSVRSRTSPGPPSAMT